MKFQKFLEDNKNIEFKDYYLNYVELKDIIENIVKKKPNAEKKFSKKLDLFWKLHENFIFKQFEIIDKKKINKDLFIDLLKINDFIYLNQTGFKKIIKKHDKNSKFILYPSWQWKINQNFISKYYKTIKEISKLYPHDTDQKKIKDRTEFKRKSIKFWVEKKNIWKVIFNVVKHLPIYIYDEDINDHIYQYISSIYLDNKNLELYHDRTVKREGSNIVRFRWYEDNMDNIFVERKTHHDDWTLLSSIKERFILKSSKILSYMKNDYIIENDLAIEINNLINNKNLEPILRTVYKRISFQLKNNDDVRVSLDIDLKFIRESLDNLEWFTSNDNIEENDINYFPFGILEIKLKNENIDNPPEWVNNLMNSELVIKKEKFSKFSHGIYNFLNHKCNIKPYWYNDYNFELNSDNIVIDISNKSNKKKSLLCCNNQVVNSQIKIEPKTFFANERTFIQWFNSAVFIGSIGIAINQINNKFIGIILILLSLFTIIYSLIIYFKRDTNLKLRKDTGYSDRYGPVFLSFVTILAFVISLF